MPLTLSLVKILWIPDIYLFICYRYLTYIRIYFCRQRNSSVFLHLWDSFYGYNSISDCQIVAEDNTSRRLGEQLSGCKNSPPPSSILLGVCLWKPRGAAYPEGSGAAAPGWTSPSPHSTCTSCLSKHGWEGRLMLGRESRAVILSSAIPLPP